MAVATNILKFFSLFVDGRGYAGEAEEIQLPNLAILEEEFRAGGMDAPIGIDMGMEKLEASFNLGTNSKEVLARFGLAGETQFTARGSLQNPDGVTEAVTLQMRGKISGTEAGSWQGGQKAGRSYNLSLTYYRYEQGGVVIHEIDIPNMIRIVNGVDQLAEHRRNIGLA
jgi:P2 family phage contractile tail tube protein